jgi:quinol monooxygenase YgiN
MPVVLIVTWEVREGQEHAVEKILLLMAQLAREEPGCIRYDVYRSAVDKRRFVLVEVYTDQAGLDAHTASEHFKHHVLDGALPLLESRDRQHFEMLSQSELD